MLRSLRCADCVKHVACKAAGSSCRCPPVLPQINAPTCNAARAGPAAEDSACLVISSSKGDASLGNCLLQVRRARKELEILREDLESREKRAAVRGARLQATDAEITSAHERALQ